MEVAAQPDPGRSLRLRTGILIVATIFLVARAAAAQMPAPIAGAPVELDLRLLLERARTDNPEILAAQARLDSMRQRPIQERTLPDPTIGLRYHNETFQQLTLGDREMSFAGVSVEQEVPFPGKLGLRGEIATREAERERAIRDATILDVMARVAVAYFELGVVDRSSTILRESLQTLDVIVQRAGTRYSVGAAAQQDVLRASLDRGAIVERLTILGSRRSAAQASLNALLDRGPTEPFSGTASQEEGARLEPLEELLQRLDEASPELRAADEDLLRSDSVLALARRQYYPDVVFAGEYSNKASLDPECRARRPAGRVALLLAQTGAGGPRAGPCETCRRAGATKRPGEPPGPAAGVARSRRSSLGPRPAVPEHADSAVLAHARVRARVLSGRDGGSPDDPQCLHEPSGVPDPRGRGGCELRPCPRAAAAAARGVAPRKSTHRAVVGPPGAKNSGVTEASTPS